MKFKAHIITHSHLDREWYMPYEQHHMRLVELLDNVLDQIDNNPDFKHFHLDGQSIPLEDYLEVRPDMRQKLMDAVKNGQILAGPWYVLQDAFLTSSEANIRNMQIGSKIAQEFGGVNQVGYYPDTFGIYSQAAQIMKKAGIDNLFFGRGVSPTGFNNQVSNDFESKYSEMILKAPDGSKVLGCLFANWYSNGNEIPSEPNQARLFWDQKLKDAQAFTPYKNLLFMNGCDHQPLQPDITKAIKTANEIYDDVEFVHSTLVDYLQQIRQEIQSDDLSEITES